MNRDFYLLGGAYFISTTGDWLQRLGLPLLVYQLTGSAVGMAATFALTFLPFLLLSIFGGVLADALDRRRLCVACDTLAAAAVVGIGATAQLGGPLWLIYVLTFVAASMSPLHHPAFQSLIPAVVAPEARASANSLLSGSETFFTVIGPLVGGFLLALTGAQGLIYINAGSFLLSAVLMFMVRAGPAHRAAAPLTVRKVVADAREGIRYAWQHPILRYGALMFIGSNFAINVFFANFVFFLVGELHVPEPTVGLVMAISGSGAVAGSLLAPSLIRRYPAGRIIASSTIAAGLTSFGLLFARGPLTVGLIWGLVSAFGWINSVTYFTLRQRVVPSAYLGRAVAVTRLVSFSSIPLGALVGGYLVQRHGIVPVILLCAGLRTAAGVLASLSPLGRPTADYAQPV
jgi:predicted MFS family arabinose efflux permease